MCSVSEIEQASDSVKAKKLASKRRGKGNNKNFADEGLCMKCPEKAVVLVRNNDPFCRDCFLDYVVHKFRATIGKARVIDQGQKVLLAVSGGSSSMAMLDLVVKGLSKDAVKKHRFQPGVVHIDDEGLCGQSVNDRNSVKCHIEELTRSVGFPYHHVSLADLFVEKDEESCLLENMSELDISNEVSKSKNRLSEVFEKISTITAREDLVSHLYCSQLQQVAKAHGYDYIMVGDCGTNLAVKILADIAQGRGAQLPFSIGFKDDRSDIYVLRPMREFTKKEIQFYNCFNDVTSFTIPSFSTKSSVHSSMNRLTEELIFGLQSEFPSTVNTVLKTGDKLSSNINSTENKHCVLCLAPLDISCGFSDVFSELTTCESHECGSGCQSTGKDGGTYRGSDGHCGTQRSAGGIDGHGDTYRSTDDHCGTLLDTGGINSGTPGGNGNDFGAHTSGNDCNSSGIVGQDGCAGSCYRSSMVGQNQCDGQTYLSTKEAKICQPTSDGGKVVPRPTHSCGDQGNNDHFDHVLRSLCYGCKLTYHDMNDGQLLLPRFVTGIEGNQFQRKAMKEQEIKEYLLDD